MACFPQRITRLLLLIILLGCLVPLSGCDLLSKDNPRITFPQPTELSPADQDPAWGPDGDRIAYVHDALWTEDTTDVSGIYVRNLRTDTTRLLVEGEAWSPDWRPDGERIAFSTGNIYTIRPDGSDLRRVTEFGSSFRPRWSPDGQTISFGRSGSTEEVGVWFAHLSDSTFTKFGFGSTPADWSPSGERIVYNFKDQLWAADTSRTDSTQLTNNDFVNNDDSAWSPDGKWIAWNPITEDKKDGFWIMRADGRDKRQLLADSRAADPAWGPNSQRIVFAKPARNSDYWALWTIHRDGSNLRQITTPSHNPLN